MSDFPSAERQNPFVQGPILPALIRFALPLMLSLLLQALYGGVDLAVVGRFSPTASAAAVATGSQVMQCATVLITGLTMGVTVCLGKAIGARDRDGAAAVVAGQIRLFALVAVVLTVVMILFAPQAARWMHVPEEALEETVRYLRICSSGMVFITAYNGISGIFRGMGNSRSPFLFVLIACVVNVVLDLLFVAVFHMAASGAALATVIAQAIINVSDVPVFVGVGGGITTGMRSVRLAVQAEHQGAYGVVLNAPTDNEVIRQIKEDVDIPVVVTVVSAHTDIRGRLAAGADFLNVSGAADTPQIVEEIRREFPEVPIIATGGPTEESILRTIRAGANAVTYTPPTNGALFARIMQEHRKKL